MKFLYILFTFLCILIFSSCSTGGFLKRKYTKGTYREKHTDNNKILTAKTDREIGNLIVSTAHQPTSFRANKMLDFEKEQDSKTKKDSLVIRKRKGKNKVEYFTTSPTRHVKVVVSDSGIIGPVQLTSYDKISGYNKSTELSSDQTTSHKKISKPLSNESILSIKEKLLLSFFFFWIPGVGLAYAIKAFMKCNKLLKQGLNEKDQHNVELLQALSFILLLLSGLVTLAVVAILIWAVIALFIAALSAMLISAVYPGAFFEVFIELFWAIFTFSI